MKRIFLIIILLVISSATKADVLTKVYLPDGTLFEPIDANTSSWVYPDIMVGTRLTIIVNSTEGLSWTGGMFINTEDLIYGQLYCRGDGCIESLLPDAGPDGLVDMWDDSDGHGYVTWTGAEPTAGDWFIIDYNAISAGIGNVGLYEDWVIEPLVDMYFGQVPTRDFDDDGIVDFKDYSIFSSNWLNTNCKESNHCSGTDFNDDDSVNLTDLQLFADFWLERTR